MQKIGLHLNPLTRKRLRRFCALRRAWWSFWILAGLYAVSLAAELVCNNRPLVLRFQGRYYFPVLRFYPEDTFAGNGRLTRPDYKRITSDPAFRLTPGNLVIFPPIPHGPHEIIDPASLPIPATVTATLTPVPRVASLNIDAHGVVTRAAAAEMFFDPSAGAFIGRHLDSLLPERPDELAHALRQRFANQPMPAGTWTLHRPETDSTTRIEVALPAFVPRAAPPPSIRLTLRETLPPGRTRTQLVFDPNGHLHKPSPQLWEQLDHATQARIRTDARRRFDHFVSDETVNVDGIRHRVGYEKQEVRWPHRPVRGHWMGIDGAGRDVLARVIYGMRTSMTFGLLLVTVSIGLGIVIGAVQGYFGGRLDLLAQRGIEIWSAIPFLYVMILLGSLFGRSFRLLLFCYGLFNWIGMSYYLRAEFLRLRRQPFVEAARGLGLSDRVIVFRHILPNALVPVITLAPFALVGAINALAALDFLGFGLPPPTASWGELIQQAQQFGWVWWLIVYPSLVLFTVMLLGVFVGEGVRNAFDPVIHERLQ